LDVPAMIVETMKDAIWSERLSLHKEVTVDPDRTVRHQVALWLEELKGRVEAGQFGVGEYQGQTYYSKHFVAHFGEETRIDAINEELWAGFHRFLIGEMNRGRWTAVYAKKLHRSARTFIEHLASLKRIAAPENLHDKRLRFTIPTREVEVFSLDEIRMLMDGARDQVRLLILLALNCGMTQVDISDLRHDELDWDSGRLRRKRSKTSHHKQVPEVEYQLWPETFELLKRLRSSDPDRVLVTKSGRPWVDRKTRNTDSVRTEFDKLDARLPFKHLRKTSATTLGGHPEFRAYAQYFLGYAPDTVADTHYVRPSRERFDLALIWLREVFAPASRLPDPGL
jgi:integrase